MLNILKKAAKQVKKDVKEGNTFFQDKKRRARAHQREAEYHAMGDWVAEHEVPDPRQFPDLATLLADPKLKFRPGTRVKLIIESPDIARKLAHGGGQKSFLTTFCREDGTVFCVWWVMWSSGLEGLKPYYLFTDNEKLSDFLVGPVYTIT